MHQVGFAQPHAAVDEQRVVGVAGILSHLDGGSLGELIGFALHEGLEGEILVEGLVGRDLSAPIPVAGAGEAGRCRPFAAVGRRGLAGADFQTHFRGVFGVVRHHAIDGVEIVFLHPVEHETVRGEKLQPVPLGFGVQRPDPGVELLFGNLVLQSIQALLPKGCVQRLSSSGSSGSFSIIGSGGRKATKSSALWWTYPHPAGAPSVDSDRAVPVPLRVLSNPGPAEGLWATERVFWRVQDDEKNLSAEQPETHRPRLWSATGSSG